MAKGSYYYKNSLTKMITTDELIKNIYLQIKGNLPEWLDDKILCTNPMFITWCNDNQELLMLIIKNFLDIKEEKISIMLEAISGGSPKKIFEKYSITHNQFRSAKIGILGKVLNTLKTIKKISDEDINNARHNIITNSDIESLGLPPRTKNILIRHQLYTIAQLKTTTYQQLKNIPYLGESSIIQIEQALGVQYKRN